MLFCCLFLIFLDIWIYMYQMYRLDEQNDFPSLFLVDDLDNEYDSSINDTIIPNLIYDIGNQLWFNISLKNVNNILSKLAHYNRSLIFFVRSMLPRCVLVFFPLFRNFYHVFCCFSPLFWDNWVFMYQKYSFDQQSDFLSPLLIDDLDK